MSTFTRRPSPGVTAFPRVPAETRQGKVFDIEVADGVDAEATLKDACEKLLANTVVENYRVELL